MNKRVIVAGKVLVLAGLVYLIQGRLDLTAVGQLFKQLHFGYAALAIGVTFLVPVCLALRLGLITALPAQPIVPAIVKSYFFTNLFVAQLGGDLYTIFYLQSRIAEKKKVLAAVFADRLIGLTALLAMSIGCVALGFRHFTDPRILGGLLVYLLVVAGIWATVFLIPLAGLSEILQRKRLGAVVVRIQQIRLQITRLVVDHLIPGLGLSFASYGVLILSNVMIMAALNLRVDALASLLYIPVISMAVMTLPISFNGLGVRESLFILFFQMAGYSSEQALAMALMNLLAFLAVSVVGGLLLLKSGENPAKLAHSADGQ